MSNDKLFDKIIRECTQAKEKVLEEKDFYRFSTKLFMKAIDDSQFTLSDLIYLNGYFIYESGDNSIIHFHIKECPNWKFAVWWSGKKYDADIYQVQGNFFCQYEPTLDKFKPSRSSFNTNIYLYFDNHGVCTQNDLTFIFSDIFKVFDYISKHSVLAWGIDYCGYDYNRTYHSRLSVGLKFLKYSIWAFNKKHITKVINSSFLAYTQKLFNQTLDTEQKETWKIELHDSGEYCSPRFDLLIKLPVDSVQGTGCYSMFEPDSIEQVKWDKRNQLFEKVSDIFHFIWLRPIDDSVCFYK